MDPMAANYFDDAFGEAPRRDGHLSHWLENSPWDPMGVNNTPNSFSAPSVPQASSASTTLNPRGPNYAAFHDWRSAGLPSASDCETVPGGDSGYGSLMPSNIDNSSIQGDDRINAGIPDVENELGGFHLAGHDTQASELDHFSVTDAPGEPSTSPTPSKNNQQMCTECNTPVRTKSEMNKHLQRHKKPHTCPYPDCSRRVNGFASNNDLVRHKRTVHGEITNGRSFVCRHEPCTKKEIKLWPRADNFRSHLLRVHKLKVKAEDDLRDYVYQQQQQSQDLEGIGTRLQDPDAMDGEVTRAEYIPRNTSIMEFPDISPPAPAGSHFPAGMQMYNQHYLMPPHSHHNRHRLSGGPVGFGNHQLQSTEDMKPILQSHSQTTHFERASQESQRSVLSSASGVDYPMEAMDHSPRQSAMATAVDAPAQTESDDESEEDSKGSVGSSSPNGSQSLQKRDPDHLKDLKPADQLAYLKSFSKEMLQQALESQSQNVDDPADPSHSNPKPNTACSTCEKTFSRPCELRKHNKRHEKPYGCTWYQCNRTFGSKNDWKRHETNQHGQIETWHCPHDCRKVFNSRESFNIHLQKHHKITDSALLERNLEESRQGSHCTNSFWCGFCNKLQTTTPSDSVNVSNQRFDHIDDHFMGRHGWKKLRIEEWQHMEEQTDDNDRSISKKTHLSEADGDGGRKNKRQRAN